jgi:hypothetical protein
LANANARAGALRQAEQLLGEVLAVRETQLPAMHVDIFETRMDLAGAWIGQGKLAAAKTLLQETLNAVAQKFPDCGRRRARVELALGTCLASEKQYAEADGLLIKSHTALSQIYGDEHPQTRRAIEQRAKLYEAWNKPEQAAQIRQLLERR